MTCTLKGIGKLRLVEMEELFLSVRNKHAPIRYKVLRGVKCPWLTSARKKLMYERDYFLRKARKTESEIDTSRYRQLRNQVIEKRRYQRNEIQDNLANPKSFWRAMKSIFPNKERKCSSVQSIMTDEGETITSNSTIVEKFKTESTRKLSNFNFQWTKTLYQNDLKNIAFFSTFFKGSRCNKSSVVTPKKIF